MSERYTVKYLEADVAVVNRELLDARVMGCCFYGIGQDSGVTRLRTWQVAANGAVSLVNVLESGTPRECMERLYRRELTGYRHPFDRVTRQQVAVMLRACGFPVNGDYHVLCSSDVDTLVRGAAVPIPQARRVRRKPWTRLCGERSACAAGGGQCLTR